MRENLYFSNSFSEMSLNLSNILALTDCKASPSVTLKMIVIVEIQNMHGFFSYSRIISRKWGFATQKSYPAPSERFEIYQTEVRILNNVETFKMKMRNSLEEEGMIEALENSLMEMSYRN